MLVGHCPSNLAAGSAAIFSRHPTGVPARRAGEAIRDWAQRCSERLELNPPEENVSGGTMDRPILNAIMERIRSGESKGIVVYRLDRFARTLICGPSDLPRPRRRGGPIQPFLWPDERELHAGVDAA